MKLFDFLFKKPPEPQKVYEGEMLGRMAWSEDDEAWAGEYGGLRYLISYESEAVPAQELLEYAREVLGDKGWLERCLEEAKATAASEYPDAPEVPQLTLEDASFSRRKGTRNILAGVAGGLDYRSWRLEIEERTCQGLGFDT